MRLIFGCAVLLAVLAGSQIAMAQDVTLTARNGGLSLAGQLISFDGEYYRIETTYGRLTVDAEGVICDGPACPDLTAPLAVIRVVGASAPALRLLPKLIATFAAGRGLDYARKDAEAVFAAEITEPATGQPLAQIQIAELPVDQAIAAVEAGQAEVVLGYSAPKALRARVLALDPLVPIVAAENRLPRISSSNLVAALTGQVTNWQEIGGPDMPIVVHGLAEASALQARVADHIGASLADGPRHDDGQALARAVARDPWAIALAAGSEVGAARPLLLTDSCDFPLPATALTVKAEDYPLTVPLVLLTPRHRLPLMLREFLEFLATDPAQAVVAEAGYVDRSLGVAPLTDDGQRLLGAIRNTGTDVSLAELQRLALSMEGGQRVSLTFRFEDGSAQLDVQSSENLADLARHIASGRFAGNRVALAGFSDGTGQAQVNLALSRSRAQAVRRALQRVAPDLTEDQLPVIEAFGEALPMACDTTDGGRRINRRVELWLHPLASAAP